jgi:hypothetical protein
MSAAETGRPAREVGQSRRQGHRNLRLLRHNGRWVSERSTVGLVIECVLIDCNDLERMSEFWQAALDLEHVWTGPSGGYLFEAQGSSSVPLALRPCGDEKRAKNRLHLDLRPDNQKARFGVSRTSGPSELTSVSETSLGSSWRTRREMSSVYCDQSIRLRIPNPPSVRQ